MTRSKKVSTSWKGKTFGQWTVIRKSGYLKCKSSTNILLLLCQCSCGHRSKIPSSNLTSGRSTRCTTCSHEKRAVNMRVGDIWESCFRKRLVNSAIKKEYPVSLSIEDFKKLAQQNCEYCDQGPTHVYKYKGIRNGPEHRIVVNGIDRIDSSLGYSVSNCVTCCSDCNFMKNKMSLQSFLHRVKLIHNKLNLQEADTQYLDARIFKKGK